MNGAEKYLSLWGWSDWGGGGGEKYLSYGHGVIGAEKYLSLWAWSEWGKEVPESVGME